MTSKLLYFKVWYIDNQLYINVYMNIKFFYQKKKYQK